MEVRVGIKVSVKWFTQNLTRWNSLATPFSVFKQTKRPVKCAVDRLDFQFIGRMKAQFRSLWAPVALSLPPSCLCFFHAHSIVFTNHCFYSELVFVFLSLLRTEDSYGFNAIFLQNNSNKICFSLPFVSFYS